ncbi:hypothetical protein NLL53_27035 [Klebsiella pneumoniae]|nr:hypothetical protein [Klebsiella pneumoniae]
MFPGSVIRKLSHSEEVFAQYEVFTSMTIQLRGVIDVDALSDAFDALLETHPVLASHLEQSSDGKKKNYLIHTTSTGSTPGILLPHPLIRPLPSSIL